MAVRDYIRRSAARTEMIAKGFMRSRARPCGPDGSGDPRRLLSLASGRPVLAPGHRSSARRCPPAEGLLAFETVEQAADAARAVARDYTRHARAAPQVRGDVLFRLMSNVLGMRSLES